MTFEEYAGYRVDAPYVLAVTPHSGPGALLYYGARHTADPSDPMMLDIERRHAHFAPDLVLNEGGDPEPAPQRAEAIRIHGETGLAVWLARRDGIARRSLEPPRAAESAPLVAALGAIRAKLFYFLRDFDTYNRSAIPESPERYAKILLDNLWRDGLRQAPTRVDECAALVRQAVPELTAWNRAPSAWFDPALDLHPWLNRAARLSSERRDAHMVDLLGDALARGRRVFAVVGYTHVIMQERALAALGEITLLRGALHPADALR
jgi:hypothetical protein